MSKKKHKILKKCAIYTGHFSCINRGEINKKVCVIKTYFDEENTEYKREVEILQKISNRNIIKPFCIFKKSIVTMSYGQSLRNFIEQRNINDKRLENLKQLNDANNNSIEFISAIESQSCENQSNFTNENKKSSNITSLENQDIDTCNQNEKCKLLNKDLIEQLINGIKYLHSKKIIHFDLKPENIIICNGVLKIIDFGSAKYENEIISKFNFTNSYTSLEYLLGCSKAKYFQDIWSLGCIMFELILGKPLISSNNTFQAISQILKIFGSPSKAAFSAIHVAHSDFIDVFNIEVNLFEENFRNFHSELVQLFKKIFDMNPLLRISAKEIDINSMPNSYFQ